MKKYLNCLIIIFIIILIITIILSILSNSGCEKKFITNMLKKMDITINGQQKTDIIVHRKRFYFECAKGELGCSESYMNGDWDSRDLEGTMQKMLSPQNKNDIPLSWKIKLGLQYVHNSIINMQSISKSVSNVESHYNIGNSLYLRMLDKNYMQYTCAYYTKPNITLEEAQINKLELICRKINLKKGDSVLDIGCGFGGLSYYMATKYGANVTAVNISTEQLKLAQQKFNHPLIKYIKIDYRKIPAHLIFDKIVSIGVMEHIGPKNFDDYFNAFYKRLKSDGIALIHTIGTYGPSSTTSPFINKYIFPGGYIPRFHEISKMIEKYFKLEDWHNFGKSYAKTLRAWHNNINQKWNEVPEFDTTFRRMWNLYLLSCAAAFEICNLSLWQIVMTKNCRENNPKRGFIKN